MKQRLVEFLTTEMGFTIFAVEYDMPEASTLNDYVMHGKGNLNEIISSWAWPLYNQEFIDMIEWMKKYNASGKGKIQFIGFDMQRIPGALTNLISFSEANDLFLKSKIDSLISLLQKLQSEGPQFVENKKALEIVKQKCEDIFSHLSDNKNYVIKKLSEKEFNWLIQNSKIMIQSVDAAIKSNDISYRDKCMAENVDWIVNDNPNEKIILWAHSGHIMKNENFLGWYLANKYGTNYYNIGFCSNTGTYSAVNSGLISTTNVLIKSQPGSFEYSFHKTGIPIFYFDFSHISDSQPESEWLKRNLDFRGIAAEATDKQFFPTPLSKLFNAFIFIDSTHSSKLIK